MIEITKEHDTGVKAAGLCRRHGMNPAIFYKWKTTFTGMDVLGVRRLRALESENSNLKQLVAVLSDLAFPLKG